MGDFAFPPGIRLNDVKGCGTSGMAALDPHTGYILKFSLGDGDETQRCNQERSIYELLEKSPLARPSSLLRFYGSTDHGILLEYTELGPIRQYLRKSKPSVKLPILTVLRWAKQAAEALQFIHANGISHGDVSCANLFLSRSLDVKLGDFTSRSLEVTPESIREDMLKTAMLMLIV